MNRKASRIIKFILLAVPFILGLVGFYMVDGRPLLQSMYITCQLYLLCGAEVAPNIWIEIARWTAPLTTYAAHF